MLTGVSNYFADSRQGCNFFRGALGVATRHNDLASGVFAMDAADGGACVLIGGGGHRTRIQDNDLGLFRGWCSLQSTLRELALQGRAVSLRGAASEILYVKTCHACIVTYIARTLLSQPSTPRGSAVLSGQEAIWF